MPARSLRILSADARGTFSLAIGRPRDGPLPWLNESLTIMWSFLDPGHSPKSTPSGQAVGRRLALGSGEGRGWQGMGWQGMGWQWGVGCPVRHRGWAPA